MSEPLRLQLWACAMGEWICAVLASPSLPPPAFRCQGQHALRIWKGRPMEEGSLSLGEASGIVSRVLAHGQR